MTVITPNPGVAGWPTDWQGCHLTGQFLDLLGNPAVGTITFKPSAAAVIDAAGKVIVVGVTRSVTLDANGAFDVILPATDDPDTSPVGWTYTVTENIPGGRVYSIGAPMNTTVDLTQVVPVPNANGTANVIGPKGDPGASLAHFPMPGAAAVSTGKLRFYNDTGRVLTIRKVRASAGTAPAGASLIVDVLKGGTTIFTTQANRPTIAAGANTATGVPDVTAWGDGEYLTVNVAQVGSTTAGSDLTVTVTAA